MLEAILLLFIGIKLAMPWWYYLVFVVGVILKLVISLGKLGVISWIYQDKTKG